jgi:sulfatase maturation enzyme AslB (radical SAM superfamily)
MNISRSDVYIALVGSDLQFIKNIVDDNANILSIIFLGGEDLLDIACLYSDINVIQYLIETGEFNIEKSLQYLNKHNIRQEICLFLQNHNNAKSAYKKK